jgi:hypothetical protein
LVIERSLPQVRVRKQSETLLFDLASQRRFRRNLPVTPDQAAGKNLPQTQRPVSGSFLGPERGLPTHQ